MCQMDVEQYDLYNFSPVTSSTTDSQSEDAKSSTSSLKRQRGEVSSSSYMCEVSGCGKVFATAPGLREHERMHSGDKPYLCPIPGCGRSFKWRSSAAMHKKSHVFQAANGKKGRRRRSEKIVPKPKKQETATEESQVPGAPMNVSPASETSFESTNDFLDDFFESIITNSFKGAVCTGSTLPPDQELTREFSFNNLADFSFC